MAGVGEEDVEYESDPEEAKLSLKMRRREASDDEDEDSGEATERIGKLLRRIDSEGESDGQGAAAEYDDEEELDIDEEDVEEYEEEDMEVEMEVEEELEYEERGAEGAGNEVEAETAPLATSEAGREVDADGGRSVEEPMEACQRVSNELEEEKKENEPPFEVPTAGAFYMHDDRFRKNAGGRHRQMLGGRKLWESKDDWKWGHDKFEEMTMLERHYEEGRTSRGHYRGRGKNRGAGRGYSWGNRSRAYNSNNNSNRLNNAPKGFRGRGPGRYQPSIKNNSDAPKNKQLGKPVDKTPLASPGRMSAPTSTVESDPVPLRKHVFASSLSSASPPFYPSGSSCKDISLTQKRVAQIGTVNQNLCPSVMDGGISMSQSNGLPRGKNVTETSGDGLLCGKNGTKIIGMDKLYIDDSVSLAAGKSSTDLQLPLAGYSLVNCSQSLQPGAQGRGVTHLGQMNYQPAAPHNQVHKVPLPTQLFSVQRSPVQPRVQPSSQASGQHLRQRLSSGSETPSPPKAALLINSFETEELETSLESSKCKTALVGKGKGSTQGRGRGSFLYGGAQLIGARGNMASGHGDQNFSVTPAFLPVMQFGGQHPGGIGVPAVGMAFPGYVSQPQLGLGNSEMTWLPVLAGAAAALGPTYCSPYIAVDGAYHCHPAGQTAPLPAASSKENIANKYSKEWKPSRRPAPANDEFGQWQNKSRRHVQIHGLFSGQKGFYFRFC